MAHDEDDATPLTREALRGAGPWLYALVRPERLRLGIAFLCLVLSGAVSLALPAVAGTVVDAALVERSLARLETVILGLIVLFALNGVFSFGEVLALRGAAARMLKDLRGRLHAHLLALGPAYFETQRTGDLLSRLASDVDHIGNLLSNELVSGLQQVFVLAGTLVVLLWLHPSLTGIMLLAVPPVVIAAVLFGQRFEKLSKARQEALAKAGVVAEEGLSGVRTVAAFAREPLERGRYGESLAEVEMHSFRAARAWAAFGGVVSFLAFSALALVLWYGGRLVVEGKLRPGELVSFLVYTLTVAGAVGSLTALYGALRSAIGATARLREILALTPRTRSPGGAAPLGRPRGEVEIRDVRFAYPVAAKKDAAAKGASGEAKGAGGEAPPALRGCSFAARAGEVTALVGPSGAGKSTIVSLLLRFHDPDAGALTLDGRDLRTIALEELRGAIGLVPQEIFLFGGSVLENIRYARPDASEADVRRAAEAAQAHAFIERLPQGYATEVGERGVRLSGGERQRIALARVFLKDPPVVVLDEATSALDAESEHLVQAALARLLEGRTTLVIAHRLATVRKAAKVVLLEAGAVADEAPHEALLARNARYRRLCELQMLAPEGGVHGREAGGDAMDPQARGIEASTSETTRRGLAGSHREL